MKHQKKRNTGLLYEFLTRHAAEGIVENDRNKIKLSFKLLKKHFREGTELHKEFRLVRALFSSYVDSKETAQRILEATRSAVKQYDVTKLDHEKSVLIRNINHTFNDTKFYDKRIDEYRTLATIQILLNEWRKDVPTDVVKTALHEEELVEHLIKPKASNVLESKSDVDDLVVNLMVKKVNNKYKGLLSSDQISLMNAYIASIQSGDASVTEMVEKLRLETLDVINNYCQRHKQSDEATVSKLNEVKALISDKITEVNDDTLAKYLRIARLKQEIVEN